MTGLRLSLFGILLLLPGLAACTPEDGPPGEQPGAGDASDDTATDVAGMLTASAASWNAGDLNGFLDDYWQSDDLTFSGSSGVTRGWEDVRQRYLRSYWAPGATRDSLRFEEIEVTVLNADHALALGRYVLYRPEGGGTVTGTGYFSLVLRRTEGAWKIIHDHTSATPPEEGEE